MNDNREQTPSEGESSGNVDPATLAFYDEMKKNSVPIYFGELPPEEVARLKLDKAKREARRVVSGRNEIQALKAKQKPKYGEGIEE